MQERVAKRANGLKRSPKRSSERASIEGDWEKELVRGGGIIRKDL